MVGIQTTKAINDLHKVTCGFWVCLSCLFTPKLFILHGLITTLPSPSIRSEDECQSAAECVVRCGTHFVPCPQSKFLQLLGSLAPSGQQEDHLPEMLLALLVKGVLLLGLTQKLLPAFVRHPCSFPTGFSGRPKQNTDFHLSFCFIFFPSLNPSLLEYLRKGFSRVLRNRKHPLILEPKRRVTQITSDIHPVSLACLSQAGLLCWVFPLRTALYFSFFGFIFLKSLL